MFIKMKIIKGNIPLLLSKMCLKKAGTVLNIRNDKILVSILPDVTCKFDYIKATLFLQKDVSDKFLNFLFLLILGFFGVPFSMVILVCTNYVWKNGQSKRPM